MVVVHWVRFSIPFQDFKGTVPVPRDFFCPIVCTGSLDGFRLFLQIRKDYEINKEFRNPILNKSIVGRVIVRYGTLLR